MEKERNSIESPIDERSIDKELVQAKAISHLKTDIRLNDNIVVCGVSLLGRNHQLHDEKCQDYHLFSDLGDGWHLYIVSDGAGSATASDRGSRWNCIIADYLIKGLIERTGWKLKKELPSELEWYQEFYAICRKTKATIEERVEMLDEQLKPKDFNATLLVLIVTPMGMLTAHIGDGRIGYKSIDGNWYSMITPHKGEEANQTIFLMNNWDGISIPTLKLSNVYVPEVRIINDTPQSVVVMSDGCENFSWNCLQYNSETEKFEDINTPFPGFWNPLILCINESPDENRLTEFITFIDSSTEACRNELDDRTILIGIYNCEKSDEDKN